MVEKTSDRLANGCAMGCVALPFGLAALWFYWMARTFLDGNTWYDFIVRFILDEIVLALLIFAVALIFSGFFPSTRLTRIVEWAVEHAAKTVMIVFGMMIGSLILFIFVYAVLDTLGIKF